MFNDTVEYTPDRTGRKLQLPCLVNEHNEIVLPLLRYAEYLAGKGYSQSHQAKVREAVRLFFEYSLANAPTGGFGKGEVGHVEHWRHFSRFRAAVVFGTFDSMTSQDPSGLCWPASTIGKGNQVVALLTDFFTYLDELDGSAGASQFNPSVTPSAYDTLAKASAYEFRRGKAFLGHTWQHSEDKQHTAYAVERVRSIRKPTSEPKRLQDAQFLQLVGHGFDVQTDNGLRDALVAILMNKGGLRLSEALQLWVTDVVEDPDAAQHAAVEVVHPEHGACNLQWRGRSYSKRSDYLRGVYGLEPRTRLPLRDPHALGWKSRFSTLRVYWFEPYWGQVFWRLWRRYLHSTAAVKRSHPYAFVMRTTGGWQPLTIDAYRKAYERGIFAAGLVPPGGCDMKAAGLTPHGCRHAYGDRARNRGGLDEKVVMVMMHHASPESQEVYTRKSHSQTMSDVQRGMELMRRNSASSFTGDDDAAGGLRSVPAPLRDLMADDMAP